MGVASTGLIFTLCFIISTFGQGFLPAIQSVATIFHSGISGEEDTGRLFGALGVVYVLGWVLSFHLYQRCFLDAVHSGRIIGPALYGTIYAVTVSFLPSAILWLSAGCSLTAFLVLAFVRLPECASNVNDAEQQSGNDLARGEHSELDPLLGPNVT